MQKSAYLSAAFCSLVLGACGGSQPAPAATPEAPKTEAAPVAAPAPSASAEAQAKPPATTPAPTDRDVNDIQAVVGSNRELFRNCYEQSLKAHPGIKGAYVLTFVINPNGTVKSAETDQSTSQIHQSDLASCAEAAVRTLKFPPNKKGKETNARYPFDFKPKGPTASAPPP